MYRNSVITFVDILGFKEFVKNKSFNSVKNNLEMVKYFSGYNEKEDGEGFEPKVIQFSDSIIRVRPLDSKQNREMNYGLAFYELLDLVHMQSELANKGILLRGGISIGEIYYENNSIYGPGFIRAYELESIYAIYPRIVIDHELIKEICSNKQLRSSWNDKKYELNSINDMIKFGEDGIHFVDYLNAFGGELDEPEYHPIFIKKHKETIRKHYGENPNLNSISAKLLWLANYHNSVVYKLPEKYFSTYNVTIEELEISEEDIPLIKSSLI